MKKAILYFAVILALLSVVYLYYQNEKYEKAFIPVKVTEVQYGNLVSTISCSGKIEEKEKKEIQLDPTVTIRDVKVKEGQIVKKGQVLATINMQDLTYQLEQARISKEISEINLESEIAKANEFANSSNSAKTAEAAKAIIEAKAAEERKTAGKASDSDSRFNILKAISGSKLFSGYKDIINKMGGKPENLNSETQNIAEFNNKDLESGISILRKQLELSKLHVKELEELIVKQSEGITSPIDGVVTTLNVQPSQIYSQPKCIVVSNLDSLQVRAQVNEYDISKVNLGQNVTITGEGLGIGKYHGTVESISPVARQLQPGIVSDTVIEVLIAFNERNLKELKPGFSVDCEIQVETRENVLNIPFDSITETHSDSKTIFVVKNGKAVEKEVVTGLETEMSVEVIKGINPEEIVIINPPAGLKKGSLVRY